MEEDTNGKLSNTIQPKTRPTKYATHCKQLLSGTLAHSWTFAIIFQNYTTEELLKW